MRRCSTPHLSGVVEKMTDLLVSYGSQSGNASGFASRLVSMAELRGLTVKLLPLSKVEPFSWSQYKLVVIVTSTYGEGAAPDNAEAFNSWLEKSRLPTMLSDVEYAVLSLGSSLHSNPFKFGNFVSNRFEQLGANRIMNDGLLDEAEYNQQQTFAMWSTRLFDIIKEKGIGKTATKLGVAEREFVPPCDLRFRDQVLLCESRTVPSNAILTSVITNELANSDPDNSIYSMEMQFLNGEVSFEAGDNISLIPSNNQEIVRKVISILGYQRDQVFEFRPASSTGADLSCSLGENLCTLELALSHFYDITCPPSVRLLQFLATNSLEAHDQKILHSYSINYEAFLQLDLSILDVLEKFSSIQIIHGNKATDEHSLAAFLSLLEPLKHRYYSIASSPDVSSHTLRIIYKVVNYVSKSGQSKQGLCTNWLKSRQVGDEFAITFIKSKFKLPSSNEVPIIMISAGSGISPYLSFMEQRAYNKSKGQHLGKAVLLHGCRSAPDFVHKPKIDLALAYGAITRLWPAYSRNADPMHVQDVIEKEGKTIWKILNDKGGILYVCGDTNVGVSVREALLKVAMTQNSWGAFKANCWLQKLVSARKIRHDEWGSGTQSEIT